MIEDYNSYHFTLSENLLITLQGALIAMVLGFAFYQSFLGMIILSPMILLIRWSQRRRKIERRKWQLNIEFRDAILSLSAALSAGYSAENALEEAWKDLRILYPEDTFIMREIAYLINQIRMNITTEKAFMEFGKRSGIEDIISFAEIFATAKRTGGDLIKIIKTTSQTISDKIDVKREILTMLSAKRYEANIMKMIPIAIIFYLQVSSPGFLKPMYHNLFGNLVMTALFVIYICAYCLIEKIITIEV